MNQTIIFEQSKDNRKIPVIINDNKKLYLQSKYNTLNEAVKLCKNINNGSTVIIFGLGGGTHIEYLAKNYPDCNLIIFAEQTIKNAYLKQINLLPDYLTCKIFSPDNEASEKDIQNIFINEYNLLTDIQTIKLTNEVKFFHNFYEKIISALNNYSEKLKNDIATQAELGKQWQLNFLKNTKQIFKTRKNTTINFEKSIVTAAGPGLNKAMPEIKKLAQSYKIIATDTSYPTLIANEIIPDYIVTIDPQWFSINHYRKYNKKTTIVREFLTSSSIPSTPDTLFFTSNHPLKNLLNNANVNLPDLDCGNGNVTFTAVEFALQAGCREILCAGADFKYKKGFTHASGNAYDFENQVTSNRFSTAESMIFSRYYKSQKTENKNTRTTDSMNLSSTQFFQKYSPEQTDLFLKISQPDNKNKFQVSITNQFEDIRKIIQDNSKINENPYTPYALHIIKHNKNFTRQEALKRAKNIKIF